VNGTEVRVAEAGIPLDDPAFHVGLGVFETVALREGRLIDIERHLDRLREGALLLGIESPGADVLHATLAKALRTQSAPCGWVKIVVTRGGRWIVLTGAMDRGEEGSSASAVLLPWRRNPRDPLAGVKTTSYAQNELGLEEARRRGAEEGIWLNTRGHLTEGCTSNLFLVHHRKVYTPAVGEGILAGVVRERAICAARALGMSVHEGRIRLRRLEQAHEAFLTSSLRGVRPLVRFEGRAVGDGAPGAVTRAVAIEVARLRRPELEDGTVTTRPETKRGDRR
jgi:branched-subunit amino acid aminotransferase/4-amino-4-deoxychorismate lyase